jgi:hypothetical protein
MTGAAQSLGDGAVALAGKRRTPGGAAVLAATSLVSSLVSASSNVVNMAPAAIGRDPGKRARSF